MKKWLLIISLVLLFSQKSGFLWANPAFASELTDDYFDIATNYYNATNYAKALEYLDSILKLEPQNLQAKALKDKISPPVVEACGTDTTTTTVLTTPTAQAQIVPAQAPKIEMPVVVEPKGDIEKISYDSNYYNTKGQEFYKKKEFDSAIEYFYKAVNLNARNAQAYNNLAMCYWFKNNLIAAIKYFKKANYINHGYTQPLVNLALLYKQLGDVPNQVYYLKKAIKYNPADFTAYYWLGDYYRNIGEYPAAIECFKEVVRINPKFSQAYLSIAMCFFETEEFNYTILALTQYQEYYPDSDFAYYLKAKANLAMTRYSDAKENIEKAIAICNNNEYQYELAKIDYYLEDYSSALDIFQNLLKNGDSAEMFNYVGLCNYKLKNIEVAQANFNKAIELDGLRPIYYYNLAQCYKSIGDKKNYTKYVNIATKITPINYQDFIDLSYIYYDNGNPSYAINSLNDAISKYPTIKALYLSKLKIYESIGDNLHYNECKDLIETRFNKK